MLARSFATILGSSLVLLLACTSTPTGALRPPASDGGAGGSEVVVDGGVDAPADAGDASVSPACAMLEEKLQKALDATRAQTKDIGMVLAVRTPDCGRWVGASGASTPKIPLDPADVLRVGSVTKTFVAASILRLADQGLIKLDDPLSAWVSGFPGGNGITVRQLLNHTSGIYDYTDDATFQQTLSQAPATKWTPAELVNLASAHMPYFAPGQGWHYSNTDYILLGMALEKATGESAHAVLHAQAFDPAGLAFTVLDGEEPIKGSLAHGYGSGNVDVTTLYDQSMAWTAGAVVASAGDLADWADQLYGGSILSASALAEMLTSVDTGMAGLRYGLGVFVFDPSTLGGTPGYGHFGDTFGYHTQMLYLPEKKTTVVSIVNSDAADPNDVTAAALDVLLP